MSQLYAIPPALFAWQIHDWIIGLVVFLLTIVAMAALQWLNLILWSKSNTSAIKGLSKAGHFGLFILMIFAMILVAISGAEVITSSDLNN